MKAIEIFSCSGGMAEGFRRAGITFDLAFDYSKDACDSYEKNLGHRPIQIDARDLVRMTRLGWGSAFCDMHLGSIDLVVADPPCTPWSRAGKRLGVEDERDMLATTFELLEFLQPTAFLIGNVPGLDDADNWHVITNALAPFAKLGYCVRDFLRLDAADYGVPQHRVRPFWYAHREGDCLRAPARTHCDPAELATKDLFGALKPWVTCRDALQHLPPDDLGRPIKLRWKDGVRGENHRPSTPDSYATTITKNTHSDGAIILADRHHPPSEHNEPAMTVRAGCGGGSNRALTWPWERPSTTVTARPGLPPPGHHPESGSIMSLPDAIVLSERAATLLQGFPESWVFCGATKKARWSQLGMAMPPALAEAVAREIVRALQLEVAA